MNEAGEMFGPTRQMRFRAYESSLVLTQLRYDEGRYRVNAWELATSTPKSWSSASFVFEGAIRRCPSVDNDDFTPRFSHASQP